MGWELEEVEKDRVGFGHRSGSLSQTCSKAQVLGCHHPCPPHMQRIRGHSGPIGQVLVDIWWGRGGANDSKRQPRLKTRTWDPHWASGMEREKACGHVIRVCVAKRGSNQDE